MAACHCISLREVNGHMGCCVCDWGALDLFDIKLGVLICTRRLQRRRQACFACTHTHTHTYLRMHARMHVGADGNKHARIGRKCVCVCVCACVCVCVCMVHTTHMCETRVDLTLIGHWIVGPLLQALELVGFLDRVAGICSLSTPTPKLVLERQDISLPIVMLPRIVVV